MKAILIIMLVISQLAVFSQSKKKLLNEINDYKIKELYKVNYPQPEDSLTYHISQFLINENFIKYEEDTSNLVFYIKIAFPCSNSNTFYPNNEYLKRDRYDPFLQKTKCYRKAYVNFEINKRGDSLNFENETKVDWENYSYRDGAGKVRGTYTYSDFELRKYLYIIYFGNYISLSPDLKSMVEKYNKNNPDDRLEEGVDY